MIALVVGIAILLFLTGPVTGDVYLSLMLQPLSGLVLALAMGIRGNGKGAVAVVIITVALTALIFPMFGGI